MFIFYLNYSVIHLSNAFSIYVLKKCRTLQPVYGRF